MLAAVKTLARPAAKRAVITLGLEASAVLHSLGIGKTACGRGAIFTLHHVRPRPERAFQPNDILDVTPEFLDEAIGVLKRAGYRFIPLEELGLALRDKNERPFAIFTLDDGYRDNAIHAAPVFARHGVPYTIFVTKSFIEADGPMWWEVAEALLNKAERITIDLGEGRQELAAGSQVEKLAAFNRISHHVNTADEAEAIARLCEAAAAHDIDPVAITRELTMRADELKALVANGLARLGAHTVSHRGLARLSDLEAAEEIAASVAKVEEITGSRPAAFAYPYGDARSVSPRERELLRRQGVRIAVTTRPGTLTADHAEDMTAVPRISLNGLYQKGRYVRALASGIPFRLMG